MNKDTLYMGYGITGGLGLLTFFHMSLFALVLAIVCLLFCAVNRASMDATAQYHLTKIRRSAWIIIISLGALYAWVVYKMIYLYQHYESFNPFLVLAQHWLVHSVFSIGIGVWILWRSVFGLLDLRNTHRLQP